MLININELLSFSQHLADESSKIIKQYFRTTLKIKNKKDETPVTIADKNVELKIRKLIQKKYPNHGILGEEFKNTKIKSEYLWVIDPIDGTRSFIAGHKDFGTLIALLHNKVPIIGIIDCPIHKERWVGVSGKKTTLNGKKIKTSNTTSIKKSYFLTSGLYLENIHFKKSCDKLIKLSKYHKLGGDCYMYGMLASGLIDIVFEDTLKIHDYMALIPVIEGANGIVSDKFGKPINLNSKGSIVATANKILHKKVIDTINN